MADQLALVLSAYLDGELVDATSVLEALDTQEGQRALVDFVRLRVASAGDRSPSDDFYARMRYELPTLPAQPRRTLAWPVGAAVAASLAIGIWTGSALTNRNPAEPSSGPAGSPPKAVRVIEFQPGVDWHQATPAQEVVR